MSAAADGFEMGDQTNGEERKETHENGVGGKVKMIIIIIMSCKQENRARGGGRRSAVVTSVEEVLRMGEKPRADRPNEGENWFLSVCLVGFLTYVGFCFGNEGVGMGGSVGAQRCGAGDGAGGEAEISALFAPLFATRFPKARLVVPRNKISRLQFEMKPL